MLNSILVTTALGKGQAVVSEEELREKHVNRTGQNVELLPLGTASQNSPSNNGQQRSHSCADCVKQYMPLLHPCNQV
jgi:hypothetical protein